MKLVKIVAILLFAASMEVTSGEFDYLHQPIWYDLYEQCSMERQSPIELNSNDVTLDYDMPVIAFKYYDTPYSTPAVCENNGHTANIALPTPSAELLSPHISNGPLPAKETFVAQSLHFHWGSEDTHGSEHVIDSKRYALEMHIVHRNTKYVSVEEARNYEGGLAVMTVLFAVDKKLNRTDSFAGLESIISSFESITRYNATANIANVKLSQLLGNLERDEFFTYAGSLTTPPCSQAVTWIVFSHQIKIPHAQMERFHKLSDSHGTLLENNYRALQATGNRRVILRKKRTVMGTIVKSPLYSKLMKKLEPNNN